METYLIKNASNLLKSYIMRLIIKKIDLINLRYAMIELLNMGASDDMVFEYEKLHDQYYLSVVGDFNET